MQRSCRTSPAVSLAAVISKKINIEKKKVVCLLSGGNIDVSLIQRIIEKGLVERGRRLTLQSYLIDSPGTLQKFLKIISDGGGNVISITHNRLTQVCTLKQAEVHVSLEVSCPEHSNGIISGLESAGYQVTLEH